MRKHEEPADELLVFGNLFPNGAGRSSDADPAAPPPADAAVPEPQRPFHRHRTDQLHRPSPVRCYGN
jgi:hypothetical protein